MASSTIRPNIGKGADLADLGRSYVSELETGRRNPTLKSINRLADALKVNTARFFEDHNCRRAADVQQDLGKGPFLSIPVP